MKQTKKQNWHVKETEASEVIFKKKVSHINESFEKKKCVHRKVWKEVSF
jgi:hypothetical protein